MINGLILIVSSNIEIVFTFTLLTTNLLMLHNTINDVICDKFNFLQPTKRLAGFYSLRFFMVFSHFVGLSRV